VALRPISWNFPGSGRRYGALVVDPGALRRLAEDVAGEAGDLLLGGLAAKRTVLATKSTVTDLVTEFDRRSEALITSRLLAARPDDAILGEEGTDIAGDSGVRWVIDPLDGTTNYLYGIPGFNVSIAAEVNGEVVAGAVADPAHGELYAASVDDAARCNGVVIAVSGATDLAHGLVATGFSYEGERRRRQAEVLATVLPRVRDLRRGGAAAIDLCWVACGRLDAFWERGLGPWDYAAGGFIAAMAGASVPDLAGGPSDGGLLLAGTPGITGQLGALLLEAGADSA
jgi:myo-inositol-1(or 4)-monophosphatase